MGLYTAFVAHGAFPLHERIKGHPTVPLLRALEETQWWTPEALEALQSSRLRVLLESVAQRVPFYRQWFADQAWSPRALHSLADLKRLPIIDKDVLRQAGRAWLAEGAQRLVAQRTSGSTGEPLAFWLGQERIAMDIAAKWRATRWWGVDIGDRELVLWGAPNETEAQNRLRSWRDRVLRSRLVPARDLDQARLDHIIRQMRAFRPRMIFGYPSVLARVATRAREQGQRLDDLGIRVAFATSEVLRPEWRAIITEVLGCAVANEYGGRDAGLIARECPHGGLHLTAEEIIVEVLDDAGHPLPPGQVGEIVITNLKGPEYPFIRYRTGDRGALDPMTCPCGRGLPLLREIEGRANDGLIALDGRWVHGSHFNYCLREIKGLRSYKIIQHDPSRIEVLLVLDTPLPDIQNQRLRTAFTQALGEPLALEVHQVEAIEPEASGKHRHVVCRV